MVSRAGQQAKQHQHYQTIAMNRMSNMACQHTTYCQAISKHKCEERKRCTTNVGRTSKVELTHCTVQWQDRGTEKSSIGEDSHVLLLLFPAVHRRFLLSSIVLMTKQTSPIQNTFANFPCSLTHFDLLKSCIQYKDIGSRSIANKSQCTPTAYPLNHCHEV